MLRLFVLLLLIALGEGRVLQQAHGVTDSLNTQVAAMAARDAIAKAVANGGRGTAAATRSSINYARMANSAGAQPYMFDEGAKRHLLQTSASYQRSDRMQMAGMAAQDAIGKAVASAGQKTIVATKKGIDYAQLANRGGVQPFMFDTGAKRRLQQNSASYQRSDRMQFAGLATQEAIGKAVASAGQRTDVATRKGITFAQLANRGGVAPFMFDTGAKRHLQQTSASYQRSDRMQMAGMAAQDAIGKAVASGGQRTDVATRKGITFAQLANRGGVQPFMFDTGAKRRLQQTSASYQRSDRMQMAGMATQDAIGKAVASAGQKTIVATKKGIDYAQLANRGGVQPFMFDTGAKH